MHKVDQQRTRDFFIFKNLGLLVRLVDLLDYAKMKNFKRNLSIVEFDISFAQQMVVGTFEDISSYKTSKAMFSQWSRIFVRLRIRNWILPETSL